ncbi:aminotransferase class V-fold PLP-dependent enzyme [Streptomyces sp. NPDC006879]|uniref:aminotransferase class V-fold PLP-dependent enzyme n=1 Tax=Streptomyces sp. NPDC006879 TaxID=3364767 RepID=UPI0036899A7B
MEHLQARASLAELTRAEFAQTTTYLNTATCGVLPRRSAAAVRDLVDAAEAGRAEGFGDFGTVAAARASFARLTGVAEERVALGSAVATHVGLLAAALPAGAEVLCAEGDFASLVNPFEVRGDLKVRYVPLESLAQEVRAETALVAVSAVQSADGRIADLAALRAAASVYGARTLVDASHAVGWLPFDASLFDFTVTAGYKWLLGSRGASYLTVSEEAQESLSPIHAGWVAGADPWASTYGPVRELARSARRFDEPPAFLAYHAAARSLALFEEVGIEAVHAHNTALAARCLAGLAELGHVPVPAPGSAIISIPGLGDLQRRLLDLGVLTAARAGNLRASFHLYNTEADVDRLLAVLAG